MARNVARAGFGLTVFDKVLERAEALTEEGARVVSDPAELAGRCDVIITMLNDARAVREAILGERGVLSEGVAGRVIVDMSTIGPGAARELAGAAAERGVTFLDAPVSGSVPIAERAELTTMVGGPREAFERAEPVLASMTNERVHLGPSGSGAAMKLAVNGLLAVVNQGTAEALVMAERAGIDRERAYDVIASSAAGSPYAQYKRPQFLSPSAPVTFTTAQMQKDLGLALDLSRELNLPAFLTAAAGQTLAAASSLGYAEKDFVAVTDVLRVLAGVEAL
jgi:3-hydroxyisobutyrate dehydrogenase/2-hydroxy-3-oxopropionate reductase